MNYSLLGIHFHLNKRASLVLLWQKWHGLAQSKRHPTLETWFDLYNTCHEVGMIMPCKPVMGRVGLGHMGGYCHPVYWDETVTKRIINKRSYDQGPVWILVNFSNYSLPCPLTVTGKWELQLRECWPSKDQNSPTWKSLRASPLLGIRSMAWISKRLHMPT